MKCQGINKTGKPCATTATKLEGGKWWCFHHTPSGEPQRQVPEGCILPQEKKSDMSLKRFFMFCELKGEK